MKQQLEKFHQTVETSKNIVVCVQCGSTMIDQCSINSIRCCSCGNTSFWDAKRFTIARNADEVDASQGFDYKRRHSRPDIECFRQAMIDAVEPMAHLLPELRVFLGPNRSQIRRKDFDALASQWAVTQKTINDEMEKLLRSEDGITAD